MKTVAKKFYMITALFMLIIVLGVFFEFKYSENLLKKEIGKGIDNKVGYINTIVAREFLYRSKIIKCAGSYISFEKDQDKIKLYLGRITEENEFFSSIYFGSPENEMINGSDWVPPKVFDLRKRPWYIAAKESNDVIYTDAFLNASKTNVIITVASAVYNLENEFIGVVAGDVILDNIFNMVLNQKVSENGFSFLVDREGKMLVQPQSKKKNIYYSLNIKDEYNKAIEIILKDRKKGIIPIKLNEQNGYLSYREMDYTGWVVASFTPTKDHINENKRILVFSFITFLFSFAVYVLLFFTYRNYIVEPILYLEKEVEFIKEEDFGYRLEELGLFKDLRKTINILLDSKQKYFKKMIENQDRLKETNDELEASLGQLIAVENELRNKYDELLGSRTRLAVSEARNRAIVTTLPDVVFRIDSEGVFTDCQANDERMLLFKKEEFIGKKISEVMPKYIADQGMVYIKKAIETQKLQEYEYSLEIEGNVEHFEIRMVASGQDEVTAILRDITKQKENQKRIEFLSYHDQLTGLYNRRYFDEELNRLDKERNLPISVIVIDVNGLKLVNDAFGHLKGDKLLQKVSNILKSQCRSDEIIARVGGDEFVILLPKNGENEVKLIAERIIGEIEIEKLDNIVISASVGWYTKTNIDDNMTDVLISAENMMYKRKLTESQDMRLKTIDSIFETLMSMDENEKKESDLIARISSEIARSMGLNDDKIHEIEIVAKGHDIGNIAIKRELLNKEANLTKTEYEEIKKHTESGYQIFKSVDIYSSLAESILSHHERWDGKGYPRGLLGDQIPIASRIIAVADAYVAMTSERPYREALGKKEAVDEILKNSGKQFDPEIVKIFIEVTKKI